jgi:hypothetical protein
MLKYPDYYPAVQRLEKLSKRADELLTGLTADNILDRIRERNAVMIQVNNLKTKLSEKPTTCDEMNYKITPVVRLNF